MDFKAHNKILKALQKTVDHGILGYTQAPESLYKAIQDWQKRHQNYVVEKEEILFNSAVVPSIAICIQAYTNINNSTLIHNPVYPPFAKTIQQNKRKLIQSLLIIRNNHFVIDLDDMENKIISEKIKLFILCSPHNPGGRVWTKQELEEVGVLCKKHNAIVISDEIHQDLILKPNQFTTFENANPNFKNFSITLTSATKTFNLAGTKNSMIFIKNKELRTKFLEIQEANCQNEINTFGYKSIHLVILQPENAYNYGDLWLENLLKYIQDNFDIVDNWCKKEMPKIKMMYPEGTYLIWLNFSEFGLTDDKLQNKLIYKGNVLLNSGITFGTE